MHSGSLKKMCGHPESKRLVKTRDSEGRGLTRIVRENSAQNGILSNRGLRQRGDGEVGFGED